MLRNKLDKIIYIQLIFFAQNFPWVSGAILLCYSFATTLLIQQNIFLFKSFKHCDSMNKIPENIFKKRN